ncbi:MAG: imidazole glycerol phosphate synthase subunit HisH [Ignavibacteriales bacterium]|nr:imidazole glycerol phosphate synthase subunit HisH [Ignavibacteriales bacterium]
MKLTILDYGAGNLKSITNILDVLEASYLVTDKKEDIIKAEKLIFPGVGHFGQFMDSLNSNGLTDCLKDAINAGIPFLGICLGLQVLFEQSAEAPEHKGLGIFPGKVERFKWGKVPQIGWNKLITTGNNSILTDDYVYFVNSYYVAPENKEIISAYCDYYFNFCGCHRA